jgi:hypothetical protein
MCTLLVSLFIRFIKAKRKWLIKLQLVVLGICRTSYTYVGLSWNITPYSPLKVIRRFGGRYRLHLRKNKPSKKPA